MVWPFKKVKEDFSLNVLEEFRILPEYRSIFNMRRGQLKKDLKRHEKEMFTNIHLIKESEIKLGQIDIERDQLQKAKKRLEQREDAETSTELRRVNSDLLVTATKFETIMTDRQRTKMRNLDLECTCELIKRVISGECKNVNDARKFTHVFKEILKDFEDDYLAPEDAIQNKVPKNNQNGSEDASDDEEPFNPNV